MSAYLTLSPPLVIPFGWPARLTAACRKAAMKPSPEDSSPQPETGLGAKANYGVGVIVVVAVLAAVVLLVGFLRR